MIKLRENVFHQTQNQRLLSDINSFDLQVEEITDEHIRREESISDTHKQTEADQEKVEDSFVPMAAPTV